MEPLLLAAAVIVAGALVAAAVIWTSGVQRQVRRTIIVNTRDDQALKGVLLRAHRDSLELGSVTAVFEDGPRPLPGGVLIPRANVSTIQLPEA